MISYNRLAQITTPELALANKALATALQQITGVNALTLPQLAEAVSGQQTTRGLDQVNAQTQAVPASVANYYINTLGTGTGNNNQPTIMDVIGTAAGWISAPALARTVEIFNTMDLSALTAIYDTMLNVINGVYDQPDPMDPMMTIVVIPPGTPGTGTYATRDLAVSTGLIPLAQAQFTALQGTYPTQTQELNDLWTSMAQQLTRETQLQTQANLVYADLTANQTASMYGFILNLNSYGQDQSQGGAAQFIEAVAQVNTFTGQSVIGCLRQGVNQRLLDQVGIGTNNQIPSEPVPPPAQAQLLPSTYTESEAENLVIR